MGSPQDNTRPTAVGHEANNLSAFTYKPPVRVPFEQKFSQVFMEGLQTRGTFSDCRIAKVGEDVKQLDYSIEYEFVPEKRNPGTKPNERAYIIVHFRAVVTDLASNNSEATTDTANPPPQNNKERV